MCRSQGPIRQIHTPKCVDLMAGQEEIYPPLCYRVERSDIEYGEGWTDDQKQSAFCLFRSKTCFDGHDFTVLHAKNGHDWEFIPFD